MAERSTMTEHERMNYWWRRAKAAEARLAELESIPAAPDLSRITRVAVIGPEGSMFERYDLYDRGAELSIQDAGRTLKIWPAS